MLKPWKSKNLGAVKDGKAIGSPVIHIYVANAVNIKESYFADCMDGKSEETEGGEKEGKVTEDKETEGKGNKSEGTVGKREEGEGKVGKGKEDGETKVTEDE